MRKRRGFPHLVALVSMALLVEACRAESFDPSPTSTPGPSRALAAPTRGTATNDPAPDLSVRHTADADAAAAAEATTDAADPTTDAADADAAPAPFTCAAPPQQCSLDCEPPACVLVCDPAAPTDCRWECAPPVCACADAPVAACDLHTPQGRCEAVCEKPECTTFCPACTEEPCEPCGTICKQPHCVTRCFAPTVVAASGEPRIVHCQAPRPRCPVRCEPAVCTWSEGPDGLVAACERPVCAAVCDAPPPPTCTISGCDAACEPLTACTQECDKPTCTTDPVTALVTCTEPTHCTQRCSGGACHVTTCL